MRMNLIKCLLNIYIYTLFIKGKARTSLLAVDFSYGHKIYSDHHLLFTQIGPVRDPNLQHAAQYNVTRT